MAGSWNRDTCCGFRKPSYHHRFSWHQTYKQCSRFGGYYDYVGHDLLNVACNGFYAGKRVFLFFEDPTNQQMFLFMARIERNSRVQKELFATLSIILVILVCSLGLPVITPSLAVRILIMAPLGIFKVVEVNEKLHV
ncbi:hypothetical protein Hdeb2414_s0012g00386311 [Helianthus debilis subsp. tardiflorus]